MNLEQFETIVEVSKTGSLTKAAKNLHVSLSAVSQSIKNLESELGIKLFNRSRSGALPTSEGKKIIMKAMEIVNSVREIEEEVYGSKEVEAGELKLATIPGHMCFLVDAISILKSDYPAIKVEVIEANTQEITESLLHDEIDIALTVNDRDTLLHPSLEFQKILNGHMVIAVSNTSSLALHEKISKEVLQKQKFAIYKDDYIQSYIKKLESEIGSLEVLFSSNHSDAILKAVRDGLAATIAPNYSFVNNDDFNNNHIVTLSIDLPEKYPVYFGWSKRKDKKFSRLSYMFIERVNELLQSSYKI